MSHTPETVTIQVELTTEQAWQLAQFCKRLSFSQCRENATDSKEAYAMIHAVELIREALREKGYAPR